MTTLSMPEPQSNAECTLMPIVDGAQESLEQMLRLLSGLTPQQYTHTCKPYVQSAIGSHVRHVLDMFHAFAQGFDQHTLLADYDVRRRNAPIESDINIAIEDIKHHIDWLTEAFTGQEKLDNLLATPMKIRTEVCLSHTASVDVSSNVGRELIFIASHAVHHFALLATIAKLQGIELDKNFGVAPATRTFLRAEKGS